MGTHHSLSVNGDWGALKKNPVSASYNEMIYDKTVLGMAYLDYSNKARSCIYCKNPMHNCA